MILWPLHLRRPKDLSQAIDNLEQGLGRNEPVDKIRILLQKVREQALRADKDALSVAVNRLADGLELGNIAASSAILFALGSVVEAGGDPNYVVDHILMRSKEAFALAAGYHRALWVAMDEAESASGKQVTDRQVREIERRLTQTMPEAVDAGDLISSFATPLLTILTRSKEARKAASGDSDFVRDVMEFGRYDYKPEGQLGVMLRTVDDEDLLVLYPKHRKGFQVRIGGIGHNFQLHTLLADAIMGGHIPGEPPDPQVVAAARDKAYDNSMPVAKGCFRMHDWAAVQADGSVTGDPLMCAVEYEGTPKDIPLLYGARVLILAPPTFERTWRTPRYFDGIPGELNVTRVLGEGEVADWLRRIADAPR